MNKAKLSLVGLILIFTSAISMGQVSLGVFGGLNSSKLSGDPPPDGSYNSLMGGNFGLLIDIGLSEALTLSLQPSYSQEGTKVAYAVSGSKGPVDSVKIRLNYFSLPLMLKVTTANKRFYALSGFEAGMLLNSAVIMGEEENELQSDIAPWNLAMHFGAGIHIPIGYPRLFIELRYSQGLVNLTDEPLTNDIIPRVKSSGFKLLCGIEFPLSKSKK